MTIKSVSTAPRCTALYNLLLKYLWFPYKIKVIINDLLSCVFYDSSILKTPKVDIVVVLVLNCSNGLNLHLKLVSGQ